MLKQDFWWRAVFLAILLGLFGFSFLFSSSRQAVDWAPLRGVALESDDWGLPGFCPAPGAWDGVDRQALAPGQFPEVYWESTLEDSQIVAELASVLRSYRGHDGLPALFQANYVMGSWAWNGVNGRWTEYRWPRVPPEYSRPGLAQAVAQARQAGVWQPELHARWHYDPELRKTAALQDDNARLATSRGITLFPGSERARELGHWRSLADLDREFQESLDIFRDAFFRDPVSIIAPDYTWNHDLEDIWESHGVTTIQAKREQRNPELGYGLQGRLLKFAGRRWATFLHPDRHYLERNVRLETAQAPDPEAIVLKAVEDTRQAWRSGEPAIVETHRVNFAHLDPALVEQGRQSLGRYLDRITGTPGNLPHFLADQEISGLGGKGVSWIRRGDQLVIRNGSHCRRVLPLPQKGHEPLIDAGNSEGVSLVLVPARTTIIVARDGKLTFCSFGR